MTYVAVAPIYWQSAIQTIALCAMCADQKAQASLHKALHMPVTWGHLELKPQYKAAPDAHCCNCNAPLDAIR